MDDAEAWLLPIMDTSSGIIPYMSLSNTAHSVNKLERAHVELALPVLFKPTRAGNKAAAVCHVL